MHYLIEESLLNLNLLNLKEGTLEKDLKDFILNIYKFDELLKKMENRYDRNLLYFYVSLKEDLLSLLSDREKISHQYEEMKKKRL